MRLTVHVTGAKKHTITKNTKEGEVKKKVVYNTLSYSDVNPDQVSSILSQIEEDGLGTPTKHYLSGEAIPGHARIRGKK